MDIDTASGHGFRAKFRPVGREVALNRAPLPRVMLLPLGADTGHGYQQAELADLSTTVFLFFHEPAVFAATSYGRRCRRPRPASRPRQRPRRV
jgi:hypothetical protein